MSPYIPDIKRLYVGVAGVGTGAGSVGQGQGHSMFSLTRLQAKIVRLLYENYLKGTHELGEDYILVEAGTPTSRVRDVFKKNPDAFKGLLKRGGTKGSYRLTI